MRILIVEDEEALALSIKNILESEKYTVEVAFNGRDGLDMALCEEYDVFILDILMPGMSGLEVLQHIRNEGILTPVLMLTSQSGVDDKVKGLDAGADDYLTKPYAPPELLARVRSLLRRSSEIKTSVIKLSDLEINTSTKEVSRDGELINVTAKEYSILEFLIYNKNRVLSRLSIAEHVWGDNFDLFSMTNFVDVHIKNLRKKIGGDGETPLIQTVRGVGYMIKDEA